jgi:hypothetical protein
MGSPKMSTSRVFKEVRKFTVEVSMCWGQVGVVRAIGKVRGRSAFSEQG